MLIWLKHNWQATCDVAVKQLDIFLETWIFFTRCQLVELNAEERIELKMMQEFGL